MSLTQSERTVLERTTPRYTALLTDEAGEPISGADLTTLTLTLYDQRSRAVINNRQAQDVLNDNDVTINTDGQLVWTMQRADNAIIGTPRPGVTETHIALFEWTWDAGTKAGLHELLIEVKQIEKVS